MNKLRTRHAILLLSVFYLVGLVIHIVPATQNLALALTEPQLLIVNLGILSWLVYLQNHNIKLIIWLTAAFVFSVAVEIIGVKTGLIFGGYHYGDTMKLKVLGVPIVIGLNWVILILAGYMVSTKIFRGLPAILFTGILVVVFDFVMEPIAMALDYWQWEADKIPLQNYLAWFVISVILAGLLHFLKIRIKNNILMSYFMIQFLFFLTLRFFML